MSRTLAVLLSSHFLCSGGPARAVRPFITDDARVVGEQLAQLESWVRGDRRAFQHWLLVAVGPWAPLELTLGAVHGSAYSDAPPAYALAGPLFQAKALILEPRPNRWPGLAVSAGATAPLGHGAFRPHGWERFCYAAVTESLFDHERLLVHANIGLVVTGGLADQITRATWGIGSQLRVFAGLHLVAEIVSGDPYEPASGGAGQAGFRYILSDRVQFDATVGGGLWGESTMPLWGTAGVRLVGGPVGRWFRRNKKGLLA
jgi:hypothetical protein